MHSYCYYEIIFFKRNSGMSITGRSYYRWYILALAMMAYFFVAGVSRMCMPVLFKEISADLGLSLVEVGTIWGMDPLAGVFMALPGGLLADRFGVKRTLVVVCILSGIFGALRGLTFDFPSMAASMFLFGIVAATTPIVVPKTTAVWFSGRRLGLANALLNMIWPVGAMTAAMLSATVLSPLLGGWRNVLFLYGGPCVIVGLLWLVSGREPERGELSARIENAVPFRRSLSWVLRIKDVWIIGFIAFTFWGSSMGLIGYLPLYLREIGWAPVIADSAITVLSGISCVGAVPVVLLSERFGSRKGMLFLSIIIMTVTYGLLPAVDGPGVFVLLIVNGLMRTGAFALFNIIIFEMEGVGSTYGGTAVGLANTFGMFGAFFSPPLGNSMTVFGLGAPFLFWAGLSILSLPMFFFLKRA
jgi:MFS family permease